MAGLNRIMIIGNLGTDPDARVTPSGVAITNITVATSDEWKDKLTGERKKETEWHKVVFFNRLAEIAAQYLSRGSKVFVEGKIKTEKYTDKEGIERFTTKVYASSLQMLDGKEPDVKPNHKPSAPSDALTENDLDDIPF